MKRNEIFEVIKSNMVVVLPNVDCDQIELDGKMSDYGADSLQIVEIVSRSMREMRIRIPRTELVKAQNLHDLVDLFAITGKTQSG